MIAVGKGVCSDETVSSHQPYLARKGKRYFVIHPADRRGGVGIGIPYLDAWFFDDHDEELRPLTYVDELVPII